MGSLFRLLVVALIFGTSWTAYKLSGDIAKERQKTVNLQQQVDQLTAALQRTQKQLDDEKKRNQQVVGSDIQELQDLKSRLQAQKDKTASAWQSLQDAKSNLRLKDPDGIYDSLHKEKAVIDDLNNRIKGMRQGEAQVGSQGKSAVLDEENQRKEDQANLNQQIVDQQALIQQTNQSIADLKGKLDFTSIQQVKTYKSQLASQKTTLQQLEDQKKTLNQQWAEQQNYTRAQSAVQENGLKQSEAQLQRSLQQEQGRYKLLQQQASQVDKNAGKLQDEVNRCQSAYDIEKAKTDSLQQDLNAAQARLSPVKGLQ